MTNINFLFDLELQRRIYKSCTQCKSFQCSINDNPCNICLHTEPAGRDRPLWRWIGGCNSLDDVKRWMLDSFEKGKLKLLDTAIPALREYVQQENNILMGINHKVEAGGQMKLF